MNEWMHTKGPGDFDPPEFPEIEVTDYQVWERMKQKVEKQPELIADIFSFFREGEYSGEQLLDDVKDFINECASELEKEAEAAIYDDCGGDAAVRAGLC